MARMKAQQAWEHTDGLLTQQSRRILYFKSELASKTSASVFSDYHYRSLFGLNNFLRSGTKWTTCTSCCAVAPVIGFICIHVNIIGNHNQNNSAFLTVIQKYVFNGEPMPTSTTTTTAPANGSVYQWMRPQHDYSTTRTETARTNVLYTLCIVQPYLKYILI